MVFSSLVFIFYFLPVTLLFYYIAPKKIRNIIVLIMSLIFYAWGEPIYILLMIFSSVVDYMHGILIEKYRKQHSKAKLIVASSVIINLSLLGFFKYADFIIANMNHLFGTDFMALDLPLPIGISFYTFQTMSYTIDVYRNKAPVQRNPIALATYVTLFPQLIAGPIVRYETIANQINKREETVDKFALGLRRFIFGLGKKVLLANNIGLLWSEIQNTFMSDLTVLTAWLGIVAFAFQIYFDFSGYSDMAIGLGKMFGFDFLENFNYPYVSTSITEFWRRWHMSLGSWFRDYVYIPLGGNRLGHLKRYRNLFIVWFLTGLWHGASWNFVLWGLYFGLIIAIEKAGLLHLINQLWKPLRHIYALVLIVVGWVLFSLDSLWDVLHYLKIMFGMCSVPFMNAQFIYYLYNNGVLLIVLMVFSTPFVKKRYEVFMKRNQKQWLVDGVTLTILLTILFISTAYLVDSTYNPFLYFRF